MATTQLLAKVGKDLVYPYFSRKKEGEWDNNFVFIQAADTQFGLIDNWAGNPIETRNWDEEIKLTKQAINLVNKMSPRPKFFVVSGDLIDAMPRTMHRAAQEEDFKKIFQGLDSEIPLICVCGNHDVGNSPTKESLESYRRHFGDDYFSFWVGGVLFIVLNSQLYADHINVPDEYEKQDKWIDTQLNIVRSKECKHCIVFQHIPWFLQTADEEDEYFNIKKEPRFRMLNKFREAGVKHIFCGHYHRNAGGLYGDLEVIVTSAIGCQLGEDKSGMRIVRVSENKIEHKYYGLQECPTSLSLNVSVDLP
ncbi:serine/threonine-protein phosphatase CPPED1-like [Hydractinia symbiolongicarpus]|uniref:serine/threonine-protein phosphatase CPPED1-like n=1 Tax=Hydractinia symbiolongicarpus TaxID=13093 RepID=UPI00254DB0C9|nr:serine/threonine-protein phosphatase CPPED1-like [Hydractinia symbiolongicarpus]